MKVFVDTSALYALLNGNDDFHAAAARFWGDFIDDRGTPVTSEWVVLETSVIVQRRIGIAGLRAFRDELLPIFEVAPVEASLRDAALGAAIASERRSVSLVDRSSFELMRRRGIASAFSSDPDFTEAGFSLLPAQ